MRRRSRLTRRIAGSKVELENLQRAAKAHDKKVNKLLRKDLAQLQEAKVETTAHRPALLSSEEHSAAVWQPQASHTLPGDTAAACQLFSGPQLMAGVLDRLCSAACLWSLSCD